MQFFYGNWTLTGDDLFQHNTGINLLSHNNYLRQSSMSEPQPGISPLDLYFLVQKFFLYFILYFSYPILYYTQYYPILLSYTLSYTFSYPILYRILTHPISYTYFPSYLQAQTAWIRCCLTSVKALLKVSPSPSTSTHAPKKRGTRTTGLTGPSSTQ